MKNVLILYATREGQTEKIAHVLAEILKDNKLNVELLNAKNNALLSTLNLNKFDYLVFGASMHAGGLESEMVSYINSRSSELREKSKSFFLVLLSAATAEPNLKKKWLADARAKMDKQLTVNFKNTEMIAGALAYSKYSWPMKWVMKKIAKQAGQDTDISKDYEYTDWQQVKRFAQGIVVNATIAHSETIDS